MKPADIFQPGMVLQRDTPLTVWGTAAPLEHISVSVQGKCGECFADRNGSWTAILPALTASENETMTVKSEDSEITFTDVAVGEVWVAGGQSNMEFFLRFEKHFRAREPMKLSSRIRFFDVPEIAYDGQEQAFDFSRVGYWRKATLSDLEYFSAVGYYFETVLERELDVPVGIVGCNWGGTASVSWMSRESAERTAKPWVEDRAAKFAGRDMKEYYAKANRNPANETGNPFKDPFADVLLGSTPSDDVISQHMKESMDPNSEDFSQEPPVHIVPGCLYEHMVKRIAPYAARGVLWYQGESDDELGQQELYKDMLAALIADWRRLWHNDSLPFLVVQLAPWESWMGIRNSGFPLLRRCQQAVADADGNVHLCSISDAGEQFDIHPKNKKVVGERLALLALGHIYGKEMLCDAPRLESAEHSGNQITVNFANAEGGLFLKGETVNALSVTDSNGETAYTSCIDGSRLIIAVPEVTGAVTIDFAQTPWYTVNLYNKAGIPAIPFTVNC